MTLAEKHLAIAKIDVQIHRVSDSLYRMPGAAGKSVAAIVADQGDTAEAKAFSKLMDQRRELSAVEADDAHLFRPVTA